jgi:hypothetical protein
MTEDFIGDAELDHISGGLHFGPFGPTPSPPPTPGAITGLCLGLNRR